MWFDSGELALSAHSFGIAHPPGHPLYMILGWCTTFFPDPLYALNLISSISMGLCIPALYRLHFSHIASPRFIDHILSLCLLTIYPIWDQGTRIEVYALASCLALWSLSMSNTSYSGIFLGACAAVNPIFAVGACVPILINDPSRFFRVIITASAVVLTSYLCIIVVSVYSTGFIWGEWTTFQGIWGSLSGQSYRHIPHSAWLQLPAHTLDWLIWLIDHGLLSWMVIALYTCIWSRARLAINMFLVIGILFTFTYDKYNPSIPDFQGYFLPFYCFILIGLWEFIDVIRHRFNAKVSVLISWIICGVCIHSSMGATIPLKDRDRSGYDLPITIAAAWLNSLPHCSALIVKSDHYSFPMSYLWSIGKVRPDLLILNEGFMTNGWYQEWIRQRIDPCIHTSTTPSKNLLQNRLIFVESIELGYALGDQTPCPAYLGYSVNCTASVPFPSSSVVWEWAKAHHAVGDPIAPRILAFIGRSLVANAWFLGFHLEGLQLGYASLGERPELKTDQFVLPPSRWIFPQDTLIGDEQVLRFYLDRSSVHIHDPLLHKVP